MTEKIFDEKDAKKRDIIANYAEYHCAKENLLHRMSLIKRYSSLRSK